MGARGCGVQASPVVAEELIKGFRLSIEMAHARIVRIVAGTIAPFEGALSGTPLEGHYSP